MYQFNQRSPSSLQVMRPALVVTGLWSAALLALATVFFFQNTIIADASEASERVFVTMDRAKIVRFEQPASAVIVGNPVIANASVYDESMLIITGKSFGTTNLIVLDSDGNEIAETLVTVRNGDDTLVTVHKGSARQSMDCSPACQPSLSLGDDPTLFDAFSTQVDGRIGLSQTNAN